jgi:hypothetical protein
VETNAHLKKGDFHETGTEGLVIEILLHEWTHTGLTLYLARVRDGVRRMNNKGQFVGVYAIQVGIDLYSGSPLYEYHGYIPTPESTRDPHFR